MIEIRNYDPEDFPQVKEILKKGDLFDEQIDNIKSFESKIEKSPDTIIVATKDKKVIGILVIIKDFFPFIFRLAIHPDFRNQGVGKKLMKRGEEILKKGNYDHANILVSEKDLELQDYYQKQGYKKGNNFTWMYKNFD